MKELYEYRAKLLIRLDETTGKFCAACKAFTDPFAPVKDGWTAHQIAFHVRDVNREVYDMRIRRTLNEDNPLFKNFDPDVWMTEKYDRDEPLEKILSEFTAEMNELLGTLKHVPVEAWSRSSSHEALGPDLSLQLWVERSLGHVEEHLAALEIRQK